GFIKSIICPLWVVLARNYFRWKVIKRSSVMIANCTIHHAQPSHATIGCIEILNDFLLVDEPDIMCDYISRVDGESGLGVKRLDGVEHAFFERQRCIAVRVAVRTAWI